MIKCNRYFVNLIFFLFILFFYSVKSIAKENVEFLSLKNNEVNLRSGPSFEHPIKLIYKKKYLPVVILDRSETWRKIKDIKNNSAINIENNSILYKKSTIYSKPIAKLEIGRLVIIKKCKVRWCKIKSGKFSGWILKNALWGKIK